MTRDKKMKSTTRWANVIVLLAMAAPLVAAEGLLTVAEKSDYKATSKHAEVVEFCERLAKMSPLVRIAELGITTEGRKLPLVILADPPITTPHKRRPRAASWWYS